MKRPRLISPHFGGYLFGIAYQNADKTIPHQNPIRLNAKGAVLLYGADIQEVRDINNNVVNLPIDDGYCYFVDKYGKPLVNGKVYTYFYQSTVPKESFDNNGVLNTNPIILDNDGKAQINIDGNYRLRIYDKDGVCMGDDDGLGGVLPILPPPPPTDDDIQPLEPPIEPPKDDTPPTDDDTPIVTDEPPPTDDTPPQDPSTPPNNNPNTGGINSIYNTDEPSEYHYIDNLNYLMINANDYTYTRNGRNNLSKIDEQDALWQLKNWDKLRKIKVLDSNSFNQKEPDMQKKISSFYPDVFYDDLFVYHRANADDSVQSIFDGVIIEPFFATTSDEVIDYINITLRNKLMEFLPFVDVEKLREYEDINTGNQYEKISIQFDGVRIAVLNRDYNNNPKSDNGEPNYNAVSNYYDYKTSYEYIQSKFPPGSKYDGYPIDGKLTTSQKSSFKKDDERVFNYIRELIDGYSKELTDNNRKRVRQIVDKRTGDPSTKENKIVAFDVTLTLMFHATLVKTVYYPAEGYDESMVFDFTLEQYVNDVVGVNFMFTFNQLEHGYYSNEKLIDLITYKSHLSK